LEGHIRHIAEELQEHLPYAILSVAIALAILGMLTFVAVLLEAANFAKAAKSLFHVFHPLHMLFSATATAAMFWRHERRLFKAMIIGLVGAAGICGLSDIVIPYISGFLLGVKMELHICLIHHPMLVVPFLISGIFVGLIVPTSTHRATIFTHSAHVLVSSVASVLYLVSFGLSGWVEVGGMVFVYMVLAVLLPCCTSDIVFPLLFTESES